MVTQNDPSARLEPGTPRSSGGALPTAPSSKFSNSGGDSLSKLTSGQYKYLLITEPILYVAT